MAKAKQLKSFPTNDPKVIERYLYRPEIDIQIEFPTDPDIGVYLLNQIAKIRPIMVSDLVAITWVSEGGIPTDEVQDWYIKYCGMELAYPPDLS